LWIQRLEKQNQHDEAAVDIGLLWQEVETLREKTDLRTRELVNEMMQQCLEDNRTLEGEVKTLRQQVDAINERSRQSGCCAQPPKRGDNPHRTAKRIR
jgi:cell division protein FtsB